MNKAEARRFITKYAAGEYTEAEHQAFHEWLLDRPMTETQSLLDEYSSLVQKREERISANPLLLERIEKRICYQQAPITSIRSFKPRWLYAAAAVIALIIVAGSYRMLVRQRPATPAASNPVEAKADISPGGSEAVLTLADGSKIMLDEVAGGTLAQQGHTKVVKLKKGELAYQAENNTPAPLSQEVSYNTIETPRGGQYQLVLPDGTKVWLNAASSLRYPTSFTGAERTVFLKGEAYFEVAHAVTSAASAGKPFNVEVNGMKVSVLGTHFNIMAYEDERDIQTTLLEGSVQVRSPSRATDPVRLSPGQQASFTKTTAVLNVTETDIGNAVAWKNGYFQFDRADTYTIMRQIARWYDVEIVYEGEMPNEVFVGKIGRDEPLSRVLRIFKLSKIKFRIEGRKIIVMS